MATEPVSIMDMSEIEVQEQSHIKPAWAVQQILYLRGQLKMAEAAINQIAIPRIDQLEQEIVSLKDELGAAFSKP
jgi:hypothetical protein